MLEEFSKQQQNKLKFFNKISKYQQKWIYFKHFVFRVVNSINAKFNLNACERLMQPPAIYVKL